MAATPISNPTTDLQGSRPLFVEQPVGEPTNAGDVWRRVYTDGGQGLRSGWVPPEVPNNRTQLLRWWAEQDAAAATAEADAAAQVAADLEAMAQAPSGGDVLALAAIGQRLDEQETVLNSHADLISQLRAATPEEVLRCAAQAQLAAGSAQAVDAVATQAQAAIKATAADCQQQLDALDGRVADAVAKVADVVEFGRQHVERVSAQVQAAAERKVADFITTTQAVVETMKGPRGDVGAAGISTVVGSGEPVGADALIPLIKRGAIEGDVYIDAAHPDRIAYRWDGERWEPGPAFVSHSVRDVRASILDASVKSTPIVNYNLGGSGGSGGGEHLLINKITRSAGSTGALPSVMIADTSNWAGVSDPTSGQLVLEVVAMNGSLQSRRGFAVIDFAWQPGGGAYTTAAELGDLTGIVSANISVDRGPASAPAGLAGLPAIPPGSMATRVWLQLIETGSGATTPGGVTTLWRISGDIEWAHQSTESARALNDLTLPKPLWMWA